MPAHANREIHLASRPVGEPIPANFTLVETTVPAPNDGQVTVRNTFMSVDPYMRGRMNAGKSYAAPFPVGEVMSGGAVGDVVESRSPDLSLGDTVLHFNGWREYSTGAATGFQRIDTSLAPAQAYLGVLGTTGLTAWIGLVDIASLKGGDIVFISGAAGAVGSVAGQMAKLRGASRVIGSAGSDAKVRHLLDDLGFDAAFNYRNGPVRDQLHTAAPDGIDLYFDNVGGDHLEDAIGAMRTFGRIALCGAISQYNATSPPPGPRNLGLAIGRRLTLRGFIVSDHMDRFGAFAAEVGPWLAGGRLVARETIVDGIENAPGAFLGLLRGDNTGKMLVRLSG
jgi:NADPH-dependent curcumin reductase CurA